MEQQPRQTKISSPQNALRSFTSQALLLAVLFENRLEPFDQFPRGLFTNGPGLVLRICAGLGIAFGGGVAVGVGPWIRCGLVEALGIAFGGGVAVGVGPWIRCGFVEELGSAFGGGVAVGVGPWMRCGLVEALGLAAGACSVTSCSEVVAAIICSVTCELPLALAWVASAAIVLSIKASLSCPCVRVTLPSL